MRNHNKEKENGGRASLARPPCSIRGGPPHQGIDPPNAR